MPSIAASSGVISGSDANDEELVAEVTRKSSPFIELGTTGLKRSAGYVDEEFLPQLRGRKAVQVYKEMSQNDPVVGAELFAITNLLRNVQFPVVPAGKSRDHANAARLVETAKDDMSHSWDQMVQEILTCIPFGWSWLETVYKRCEGPWQRDGRRRSKYSDGLMRWRKMPIRAQETMQRWAFDADGNVRALIQLAPPDYQMRTVPIEKSLLFRMGIHKNNPEGVSLLRTAYRPWFYKKRLEEFESIGIERDLAGLPMVKVPLSWMTAAKGSDEAKLIESFKRMVKALRRNEQEGIVFPIDVDDETKKDKFDFQLLGSGGARQFSTDTIIQRLEQRILMAVLADWIIVGHQQTGTYNMHVDKRGVFEVALNATAQMIADIFNRYAIPRLFAVNGWRPAELPTIQPSNVDSPDLTQLAQFLGATAQLGYVWGPDGDLEQFFRRAANMPQLAPPDLAKHQQVARREDAIRLAERETRYLAARSSLVEAKAQAQLQAAGVPGPDEQAQLMQQHQADTAEQGTQQDREMAQSQSQTDNRRAEEQHQAGMLQGGLSGDQAQTRSKPRGGTPNGRRSGGGNKAS